jgi:hypothetical protein
VINLANVFRLKEGARLEGEYVRIRKELNTRLDGCFTNSCWTLKDEGDDGYVYLSKSIVETNGNGIYIPIRRYLFYLAWKSIPDRRKLITYCHTPRCENPAHAYYKGFKQPYERVKELIDAGWISQEKADNWYLAYTRKTKLLTG